MPSPTSSIQLPPRAAAASLVAINTSSVPLAKLGSCRFDQPYNQEQVHSSVEGAPCRRRLSGRPRPLSLNLSLNPVDQSSLRNARTSASPSTSSSPRPKDDQPESKFESDPRLEQRRAPVCAQRLTHKLNALSQWQHTQIIESRSRGRERLSVDFLESYQMELPRSRSPSPRHSGEMSRDETEHENTSAVRSHRYIHRSHLTRLHHHHHHRRCHSADPGPGNHRADYPQQCIPSLRNLPSMADGFCDPSDWNRIDAFLQLPVEPIPMASERRPRQRRVNPALLEELYNGPSTLYQHHGNANLRHS